MPTRMDENEILTRSIGENAVDMIGRDHLRALSVLFDARDAGCTIAVVLRENTDEEQLRAIDRLIDVQMLFIDEASIEFRIDDEASDDSEEDHHTLSQRQFCYA